MRSLFIKEYIKNVRSVGAVAPSSRFLAQKMLESVDFSQAKVIVEFGPGTGSFTHQLVKCMKPGTKLIVIETNKEFYRMLRDEYAGVRGVEIINSSAEQITSILSERKLPTPDYVISGLPFAALPTNVSEDILSATAKLLGNNGTFITFQYTLLKRSFLNNYFSDIHTSREYRNLPPAYVLRCRV